MTGGFITSSLGRKSLLAAAVAAVLAASGCGGGGGGSEAPAQVPQTTKLSGVVAKGLISNGTVTALELDSRGKELRTVGQAQTGQDGRYELSLGSDYTGGPILLRLAAKGDGSTRMVCDIHPTCGTASFGEWVDLPAAFVLESVIPVAESGQTVKAQVTPFTHMAAARLKAMAAEGTIDAAAATAAISEVSQIVGVDIQTTEPVNLTDSASAATPQGVTYALFNAGVGRLVFAAGTGGVVENLSLLAASFEDGLLEADEIAAPSALLDAVTAEIAATDPAIDTTLAASVVAAAEAEVEPDGSYDPEPSESAGSSAVEQAKALVADARTIVTIAAGMESPAQLFAGDIELAGQTFDSTAMSLGQVFGAVIASAMNDVASKWAAGTLQPGSWPVDVVTEAGELVGEATVTIDEDASGRAYFDIQSTISGVSVAARQTATFSLQEMAEGFTIAAGTTKSFIMTASVSDGTGHALTLDNMQADFTFEEAIAFDPATGLSTPNGSVHLVEAALVGGMTVQSGDYSFIGESGLTFVGLEASAARGDIPLSLKRISAKGRFAAADGRYFEGSAALTVDNASTFDAIAFFQHQPEASVVVWEREDLLGAQAKAQEHGIAHLWGADFWGEDTCFWGEDGQGDWLGQCVPGDELGVNAYLLENTASALEVLGAEYSFYREHYTQDPVTYLNGYIVFGEFESATYFARGSLTLGSAADLKAAGFASVGLTVNRATYDAGNATMVLRGGDATLSLQTSFTADSVGGLTISNSNGVSMVVDVTTTPDGTVTGTISVDDEIAGSISQAENGLPLIRYADGTFESLN